MGFLLILSSIGFSYTSTFVDRFATYGGNTSAPDFTSVYQRDDNASSKIATSVASFNGSIALIFNPPTGNLMGIYRISPNSINSSSPLTISSVIKASSIIGADGVYGSALGHLFFFINFNHSDTSDFYQLNQTAGYLVDFQFSDVDGGAGVAYVKLFRCPYGFDYSAKSCNLLLASDTINATFLSNMGITKGSYAQVNCGGKINDCTKYVFNNDVRFKVAMDSDHTIKVFANRNDLGYDTLWLSYFDESMLHQVGAMGFGELDGYSTGIEHNTLAWDDIMYYNSSNYSESVAGGYQMLSYPEFNATSKMNFYELSSDSKTNWIALNEYVYPQWTIATPVGTLNQITQTQCPIFDMSEATSPAGWKYSPRVPMFLSIQSNVVGCVARGVYATTGFSYTYNDIVPSWIFGGMSVGDYKTLFNLTETERPVPVGGWTELSIFVNGDNTTNKYALVGTALACSVPANLTLAFQMQDINSCDGGGTKTLYKYLYNVGINPATNQSCDIQLLNGSCYYPNNGTTGDKGLGSGGSPFEVQNDYTPAQKRGIDDVFSPEQGGGIVGMFSTPAFLGMFASLVVGAGIGWVAGPLLGIGGFIGSIVIATGYGLFPIWIGFVIAVLTAFATAILIKQGILG